MLLTRHLAPSMLDRVDERRVEAAWLALGMARGELPPENMSEQEIFAELAARGIHWDLPTMNLVSRIERAIVRLELNSQAEFVSLLNTLQVQLESGDPDPRVITLLGEALLALARARGLPDKLGLPAKLEIINQRIADSSARHRGDSPTR